MNLFEATYTFIYFPTGGAQTTQTVKIEFYASNYNVAMMIAASRAFSMHYNSDYLLTAISLATIITNRHVANQTELVDGINENNGGTE